MNRVVLALAVVAVALLLGSCPEPFGAYNNPKDPGSSAYLDPTKSITAFSFASPVVTGIINETAKTISVTVSYGTNVTALVATFAKTGISVNVGGTIQVSGSTPNNFTSPVIYIVTAADASTQAYTVSVTIASNTAKAIMTFDFSSPAATGTIMESTHSIALTVPFGTNVSALVPTITHTGASISPTSGTAHNFTSPATYTVTAADASTQAYLVTVTVALNPAKAIMAFDFASPAAIGTITESTHSIALTVPFGTNVTALVPTITHTGTSISPSSGTAHNFTSPATYTVTAANASTQAYTVTVTIAPNTAKAIMTFNFASPSAIGAITESTHAIAIIVPIGTNVTTLVPTITHTGASISPTSGTAQDFTSPATYTVTAADASIQAYTVTVTISPLAIGDSFQGGKIAYIFVPGDSGYIAGETHGLIAPTADQSISEFWITGGSTQTTLNGNTSIEIGTGLANSNAIITQSGHISSAAKVCRDYSGGGYSDWYLPSLDELNKLYLNRAAIGGFSTIDWWWSSSEYASGEVWGQTFGDGLQGYGSKGTVNRVRAVRTF